MSKLDKFWILINKKKKQKKKNLGEFTDIVTTGILQIRWTGDGDKDVAALATMYIDEVPNESSIS